MKILGYGDQISVASSQTINFMVSCEGPRSYRADVVRIICGDENPEGPGYKEALIKTPVSGRLQGPQAGDQRGLLRDCARQPGARAPRELHGSGDDLADHAAQARTGVDRQMERARQTRLRADHRCGWRRRAEAGRRTGPDRDRQRRETADRARVVFCRRELRREDPAHRRLSGTAAALCGGKGLGERQGDLEAEAAGSPSGPAGDGGPDDEDRQGPGAYGRALQRQDRQPAAE